jgi:hypothetical protein
MKYIEFVKKYFLLTKLMHAGKGVTMTTYSIKLLELIRSNPLYYERFFNERGKLSISPFK